MNDMHLQTDKTSLDSTKITFFRGIFAYFFHRKLFSASFLIGLCSSCLLWSTGFRCSRKNRHALDITKKKSKSNTSNHFSDLLPLRREVDPLSPPLLSSQSVKKLYVKDTLTKQQPSGTKPTSIALAQPNLLENRLQKAPLPSKDSSTSLPVPPLSLEQKDNLIVLLALEETLSSPETGVVAKDDPKKITPTNNIQSKKPKLLAEPKLEGTYPNTAIAIESSNVCNRSNVNNNVNTDNNIQDFNASSISNIKPGHVKNFIADFESMQKEEFERDLSCKRTPTSNVTRFEKTYIKPCDAYNSASNDEYTEHIENKEKTEAIKEQVNQDALLIDMLYNCGNQLLKINIRQKCLKVLERVSELIELIQKNNNFESAKIKLQESNNVQNKLIELIKTDINAENDLINLIKNEIKDINKEFNTLYTELCETTIDVYKQKDTSSILSDYVDLIKNFKGQIKEIHNRSINISKSDAGKLLEETIKSNNEIKNMISHLSLAKGEEETVELLKEIIERKYKKNCEIHSMITSLEQLNSNIEQQGLQTKNLINSTIDSIEKIID